MDNQQLHAYMAWVNSQLKKKPGSRHIEDLRCDMQDGVALADLIEIVADERLTGIYPTPGNLTEKRENVEQVLQFMKNRRIRMHHTTAKDIVEGNLKSIMRLILALAAHFKPSSVKQSSQVARSSPRSMTGIAQGAAAAIADARRDAATVRNRPQRPRQLAPREIHHSPGFAGSGSESEHQQHAELIRPLRPRDRDLEGASSDSSAVPSAADSPRSSAPSTPQGHRKLDFDVSENKQPDMKSGGYRDSNLQHEETAQLLEQLKTEFLRDNDQVTEGICDTKKTLLQLQELLLSGVPPDGAESPENSLPIEGSSPNEQIVILQSRLLQSEEVCKDLREELSRLKGRSMELQGTKGGLQHRLMESEESFLKMKAELLKADFTHETLENEKTELHKKLESRESLILELRRELSSRDKKIEDLVGQYNIQQQEYDILTQNLRTQINDLHERLKRVGDSESSLSAKVMSQDRKMAKLEGKIMQSQHDGGSSTSRPGSARSGQPSAGDDLQLVRDSLQSLRGNFPATDPQQVQIMETLEQSICSLMDRLYVSEQSSRYSDNQVSRRMNYDSTGDSRRSPLSAIPGFPVQRLDQSGNTNSNGNEATKVLYFTDRTVTPFMCTIPIRLGDITLKDFKNMFDRHGAYRFHFKAMDPEFGTVKEEITHDDDVIPGWEGKIVAWIEEDHG